MNLKKTIQLLVVLLTLLLVTSATAQSPPALPALNSPASGEQLHGKFIWFDLATPSLGDQQSFYQTVFGWSFDSISNTSDDYVLVKNKGQAIAGMFSYEKESGEKDGATWLGLISVADVSAAVAAAKRHGGSVEVSAASVPNRGEHALLRDPANAIFGVLKSSSGDPVDQEIPVGGIMWADLFARDMNAMANFYGQLAPYSVENREIAGENKGKLLLVDDVPRAGIVEVDEEANRSAWIPYVRVADIEVTQQKVIDGGGFAIVAPDPQLLDGKLAVFVDPNGGVIGAVEWTYEQGDQP